MTLFWLLLGCRHTEPSHPAADCAETPWYSDGDGDGFGIGGVLACEAPLGHVAARGDCDDLDPAVNPGAAEQCDGLDQNCDGEVDEALPLLGIAPDGDGDGFGDITAIAVACAVPDGWVEDTTDCDDADEAVFPGQVELCNGIDDDCDGLVDGDDDGIADLTTWHEDEDEDGYGDPQAPVIACEAPAGWVVDASDCDDDDSDVHPGAEEICLDFEDQDCDGYADDYECLGNPIGEVDLCDPTIVPVDIALCADGAAAVLADGTSFATVSEAILASADGEVVSVCPGEWVEDLRVRESRELALVGYGASTSVLSGAGGTTLDVGYDSIVTLVDLGVTNGYAESGGGVAAVAATLCVARSAFLFNHATGEGGAIAAAALTIEDTVFYVNDAEEAGGAVAGVTGAATIASSFFYGNGAVGRGGAMAIDGSELSIDASVFYESWSGEGGALSLGDAASGVVTGTAFASNMASGSGGAATYHGNFSLAFTDVSFTDNVATASGGALELGTDHSSVVSCTRCSFDQNVAASVGGAVYLSSKGTLTFNAADSTFTGNTGQNGGAVAIGGSGDTANLDGCVVDANTATNSGGGFHLTTTGAVAPVARVNVTDSTITSNVAATCGGLALNRAFASVSSINTDWGSGATDNAPDDVCDYSGFGAAATFTCQAGVCE